MFAKSPEPMSTAKRLKRAFCLFVCGCLGLLVGIIGETRVHDDDDRTSAYLVSTTCTIVGIVAGFCLARLERHVRVWEIIVATILILLLCAFSFLGTGGRVR
jgi:hypothetical protein